MLEETVGLVQGWVRPCVEEVLDFRELKGPVTLRVVPQARHQRLYERPVVLVDLLPNLPHRAEGVDQRVQRRRPLEVDLLADDQLPRLAEQPGLKIFEHLRLARGIRADDDGEAAAVWCRCSAPRWTSAGWKRWAGSWCTLDNLHQNIVPTDAVADQTSRRQVLWADQVRSDVRLASSRSSAPTTKKPRPFPRPGDWKGVRGIGKGSGPFNLVPGSF